MFFCGPCENDESEGKPYHSDLSEDEAVFWFS